MKLYFENSYGKRREIADCVTAKEVGAAINKFVEECNARKPAGQRHFEIIYTRMWKEDNMIKYDIGSWSEFFLWDVGNKTVEELYGV